ncbi:MAG: OmpA/MotB family protein [Candidatus Brocadiales bacterium]
MLTRPYSSFLLVAFLTPIVIVTFLGCAGRQRKSELLMLQGELGQQSMIISELEQENTELKDKLNRFSSIETLGFEPEAAKALLESKLAGTGVTVQATGLQIRLLLPSTTLFSTGKATLKATAKAPLKKVARTIKVDFPYAIVRVEGHTDNIPIKKVKKKFRSNWELSAARAATVAHFFVKECFFDPTKIYIAGFGEYLPIASNKTKAGRQKNRRVEIVILSEDASLR